MSKDRFFQIISIMIDYGMLDPKKIYDVDYVTERVSIYLEAKNFVDENFKGCF